MSFAFDKKDLPFIDLHMHTNYCDGKDAPEQMVLSAVGKGLKVVGITCHSYTHFEEGCSITPQNELAFIEEIKRLKEKYLDKIKVLCGIEWDLCTTSSVGEYDYIIGSMHYYRRGNKYFPVDKSKKDFIESVNTLFNGDYYLASEEYYQNVANIVESTNCDIIGHLDLITKFNIDNNLFDENDPRYISAYKKAVDTLVKFDKPFEINTGVISRGYRLAPYPSKQVYDYIKKKGGKFILSSDSHSKENVAFEFDKWKELL
ncbi:MAG: histidinol-phosphatase HisJ family protein [Clostridiales bacterium]|nr:histidinol-phosphatase HisJ family protein [Clostridiales bacterium]